MNQLPIPGLKENSDLSTTSFSPKLFADKLVEIATHNDSEPLEVAGWIYRIEKAMSLAKSNKNLKEAILDAIEAHEGNSFNEFGSVWTAKNYTTKDYDVCGDPLLKDMKAIVELFSNCIKERMKLLDSIPKGGMYQGKVFLGGKDEVIPGRFVIDQEIVDGIIVPKIFFEKDLAEIVHLSPVTVNDRRTFAVSVK